MFDIYGLAAVHLQPTKKMNWDELAALFDRPSLLQRGLSALAALVSLRARLRRATVCPDLRDRTESAGQCRVPA